MIANAKRANASDEYVAVTSIPIADQITRELLPLGLKETTRPCAVKGRKRIAELRTGLLILMVAA